VLGLETVAFMVGILKGSVRDLADQEGETLAIKRRGSLRARSGDLADQRGRPRRSRRETFANKGSLRTPSKSIQ
jgi:hypothetical protein